jgi:hypothetical protein
MPELVDALAEHCLAYTPYVRFANYVIPGKCPIKYLQEVHDIVCKVRESSLEEYRSQLEAVRDMIAGTIYKLKRLRSGIRSFSTNIDTNVKISGSALCKATDAVADALSAYFKKYKKSPVKDIPVTGDKKRVKQYVRKRLLNGDDISDLLQSLSNAIKDTVEIKSWIK